MDHLGEISSDLFIAPFNNINDTVLVASNVDVLAYSSDERFVFGVKVLHGEYVNIILDVKSKRLQYMFIDHNSVFSHCYYYPKTNKFVCDNNDRLIYFDIPVVFPFNALENRFSDIGIENNDKFWEKIKKLQEK